MRSLVERYSAFMADMGLRPSRATLKRADVDADFGPRDCIWRREGCRRQADSQGLPWSGVFAAAQTEHFYEDNFPAVASHLKILHLDGLVDVDRWVAGEHKRHRVPPDGTFVMPGGVDFRVWLGGTLSTVHV